MSLSLQCLTMGERADYHRAGSGDNETADYAVVAGLDEPRASAKLMITQFCEPSFEFLGNSSARRRKRVPHPPPSTCAIIA